MLVSMRERKREWCPPCWFVLVEQFPTGLALAIEKKSRRIEISLYCLARAIESFFTCMGDAGAGYLPRSKKLKRADVVIFSISTAIIMHCYAIERDVFRSKYLNVLDWVFGVPLPLFEATPRKKRWLNHSLQRSWRLKEEDVVEFSQILKNSFDDVSGSFVSCWTFVRA